MYQELTTKFIQNTFWCELLLGKSIDISRIIDTIYSEKFGFYLLEKIDKIEDVSYTIKIGRFLYGDQYDTLCDKKSPCNKMLISIKDREILVTVYK